jgi:hypothetical protein
MNGLLFIVVGHNVNSLFENFVDAAEYRDTIGFCSKSLIT